MWAIKIGAYSRLWQPTNLPISQSTKTGAFELWRSGAANIPPQRSTIMAMSKEMRLALARQVAHRVAQNYGLSGFREES